MSKPDHSASVHPLKSPIKGAVGFIVYTLEEGGRLWVRWGTYWQYREYRDAGRIPADPLDVSPDTTSPVVSVSYIAWSPVAADYDFVLNSPRESNRR